MMRKKLILALILVMTAIATLAMVPKSRISPLSKTPNISYISGTTWTTPVNISNTPLEAYEPTLGVDGQGKAYIAWVEFEGSVPRSIYFNTNKSGQWPSAQKLANVVSGADDVAFPCMITTPEGICSLGYHDLYMGNYEIVYYEYNNGWSGPQNLSQSPEGTAYITFGQSPTDSYIYGIWQDGSVREWEMMYRYRDPNTKQWGITDTIPLLDDRQYTPWMTVDGKGAAHLVFITRSSGSSTVWYAKNPEPRNNSKWTAPVPLASSGVDWCWPKIAGDNNGDVYVVWTDATTGNLEIFLKKTINGQWQAAENISKTQDLSEGPSVAVNKSSGELYIGWQESVGGSNWEVYLKTYEQERAGEEKKWSSIINISNTSVSSGEPKIVVADNGDVHIAYIERATGNLDVFYTYKIKIKVFPPLNVALQTSINKVLFYDEKINTITFSKNPSNDDAAVANYKLYRRKSTESDDKLTLLATLSAATFSYDDRHLPLTEKYAYALTTIDTDGNESKMSDVVTEK